MPTIAISTFQGEIPRTTPRLLQDTQATLAINCQLGRGHLEAMRGPGFVESLNCPARNIFKHGQDGWLAWDKPANVVKSQAYDASGESPLGQLFITGDRPYPTQYLAGGHVCRLGLPRPAKAPLVEVVHASQEKTCACYAWGSLHDVIAPCRYGDEGRLNRINEAGFYKIRGMTLGWQDDDSARPCKAMPTADLSAWDPELITECSKERSTAYCYTYVRSLAGGVIKQESAPSPASGVTDVPDGCGVKISGFRLPDIDEAEITHIRIYRAVTAFQGHDFHFVCEIVWPCDEYLDTSIDRNISAETLQTTTWDPIPDDAQGLIVLNNGIYAAFRGNELLLSEPYHAYAFPSDYRLLVEDDIVALGQWENTIIVLTRGKPYMVNGTEPGQMQVAQLQWEQSCVAALSLAYLDGDIIYATPDGLARLSPNGRALATERFFTREQWQEIEPETILGAGIDGKYLGFFTGTNRGFLLGGESEGVVRIELPKEMRVWALRHHSVDDCVYMAIETNGSCGVWQWQAGELLEYVWRSKPFFTSRLCSMRNVRIEGEQTAYRRARVKVFGPDMKRPRQKLALEDTRTKHIQSMRAEKLWSIELNGVVTVYEARLGTGVEDLEYGI